MGAEIFHALSGQLKEAGHNTNVGDEGGFAPNLASAEEALGLHHEGDREGGLQAGRGRHAGARLRPRPSSSRRASTSWKARASRSMPRGMVDYFADLVQRYPIVSIEDGMAEDDMDGWKAITDKLGKKIQLVGDDLFVTNPERLADGIKDGLANAILVKVNQIGTLTETLEAVVDGAPRELQRGDVAPLGRDRGLDHRRPRRRHQLRPDQDRLAVALRPPRQVQPAPAHRGAARHPGALRRPVDPAQLGQRLRSDGRSRRTSASTARASGSTIARAISSPAKAIDAARLPEGDGEELGPAVDLAPQQPRALDGRRALELGERRSRSRA